MQTTPDSTISGLTGLLLTLALAAASACSGDSTASESDGASTTQGSSGATATGESTTAASAGSTAATDATGGTASGSTTTSATGESSSTTATTGVEGPSFTDVYEQIILPQGCNAGYCHGGGAGGLMMTDEATSYANLVEVEAMTPGCGATLRVAPGAPDESVLWHRARPMALDGGMAPCAPKMPQGSTGLSDADGQLLLDWITAGALE